MGATKPKVLFVDDEPHILASFQVSLRKLYAVSVAATPEEGLRRLKADGPFPVVVSDLRMPGMTGIEFLSAVQAASPESIRIMLTGYADVEAAIAAVNKGHVFRFLTKPCPQEILQQALADALDQHALEQAERDLLKGALRGSVKLLTDVLAMIQPAAFGRGERITRLAVQLGEKLGLGASVHLELAAMLCQLGCVALEEPLLLKLDLGQELTPEEKQDFTGHAGIGAMLLKSIPRMGKVAEIIRQQFTPFQQDPPPLLEARVLSVCQEYERLLHRRLTRAQALERMRGREGHYDPAVLQALEACDTTLEDSIRRTDEERSAMASIPDVIREAAKSTSILGQIMQREEVRRLLLGMEHLHAPPSLLLELNRELNLPEPSLVRVGQLVLRSPNMAQSLLRVVNSPGFNLLKPITDMLQAVAYLGTETMRGLVVGVHLFSLIPESSPLAWLSRPIWRHSLQTAHFARCIALQEGAELEFAGLCFVGGLLHDIGKVLFICQHPEAYQGVLHSMREEGRPELAAETLRLGAHHGEAGAALLGVWGLPEDVLRAVLNHHSPAMDLSMPLCEPSQPRGEETLISPVGEAAAPPPQFIHCRETSSGLPASLIIHVANWMDHVMAGSLHTSLPRAGRALDRVSLQHLGLDERLDTWRTSCELSEEERAPGHEA
ncbi:HDOD domain-containing protein [Megalodesulfovibrio paquesii]